MKNLHEGTKAAPSSANAAATHLHPTMNDLPEKSRKKIVKLLNGHLADAIDLKLQLKQAHWNIRGANFIALHELFDTIAAEVDGFVDEIAERTTALGGIALGTSGIVASGSSLPDYPLTAISAADHVDAVSIALSCFGKRVRQAAKDFAEAGDDNSTDLMTEISRAIDKRLWMVEAHGHG